MIEYSTLRLFKGVPITTKNRKQDMGILKKTIQKGYILSPEVINRYSSNLEKLIERIEEVYGTNAEKLNNAFHKSWAKVRDANIEQLVVEQLAHYVTTYGKEQPSEYIGEKEAQWRVDNLGGKIIGLQDFESNRTQDDDYIYIPKEKLDIPEIDVEGFRFVVIRGYTKEELESKLLELLNSGIALKEQTINDAVTVSKFIELDREKIAKISNKEVKVSLFEWLGLVPENPVEFLRLVIHNITGETLIIKNNELIEKIREGINDSNAYKLFTRYTNVFGMENLAQIFYRFKPLFLAFKEKENLKPFINKLRKLTPKCHKPLKEDFLNTVTAKIGNHEKIDREKLRGELQKVNIFRKIRLAYALNYRTKDPDSIVYKIRNGKGWATDFRFGESNKKEAELIRDLVLEEIIKDVRKKTENKKVYIPNFINYSLPATEKQFTGDFPSGTYVEIPYNMIFGIHWENIDGEGIDLDLSLMSLSGKFGWDADYRDEERNILFSGDLTDAPKPKGASELFYINKQIEDLAVMYVNYFNYNPNIEVPFKILVGQERHEALRKNHMIDSNNILAFSQSSINQRQKILGLVEVTSDKCRFYFSETHLGNSITAGQSKVSEWSRNYLINFYTDSMIGLKNILKQSGVEFVDNPEDCDVNLSPENIERNTILTLFQ